MFTGVCFEYACSTNPTHTTNAGQLRNVHVSATVAAAAIAAALAASPPSPTISSAIASGEQVDAWMHVLRVDASTGCMYSGGINWMHVLRRQLSKEIFGPFGTICRAFRSVNGKICCKKVEPAEEHRAPSSMLNAERGGTG